MQKEIDPAIYTPAGSILISSDSVSMNQSNTVSSDSKNQGA